jgi:hypothetical protein
MPLFDEAGLKSLSSTLGSWAAWFAFGGFLLGLVMDLAKGKAAEHNALNYIKTCGLAASLPAAAMLLYGGMFQPEVVPAVASLRWPIVAAGALFLYTSIKGIIKP